MEYRIQSVPLYIACFACFAEYASNILWKTSCRHVLGNLWHNKGSLSQVWKLVLQCQTFCIWNGMCVTSFFVLLSSAYDLSFTWCQHTLLAVSVLNCSTILVKCSQSLLRDAVCISLYNMALLVAIKRNLRKVKEVVF